MANLAGTREASHADSWYKEDATSLSEELDDYLGRVPSNLDGSTLPVPGARIIIAPHAGYDYSGPCAAWAYKALDLAMAKRVFILGPSHTYYLKGCALTTFGKYATPFGDLVVDQDMVGRLAATGKMGIIPHRNDVSEHSLEMHLPYLWKRLEQTHGGGGGSGGGGAGSFPSIVPILVGNNNEAQEKALGQLLAPYFADPETAVIVSSDFCHWGSRFQYSPCYRNGQFQDVQALPRDPTDPPIHEAIKMLDEMAMDAVKTGVHGKFVAVMDETDNTVCGRHPIGVAMAALEVLAKGNALGQDAGDGPGSERGRFQFVQYQRSSLVTSRRESSVSYAAAYAVA